MDVSIAESNELPPACEQAMANWLLLAEAENEYLAASEKAALDKHLADCATCRVRQNELIQINHALRSAFQAAQTGPDFVAQTMARLPAAPAAMTPTPRVSSVPSMLIFTAQPRRHWILTKSRLVATFVISLVGATIAVLLLTQEHALAVPVMKGVVTDNCGRPVKTLITGQDYRIQETTVLALNRTAHIKAQPGAEFQLKTAADKKTASFTLNTGDLYASVESESAPLRMECAKFDAELYGGDFYVAQDTSKTNKMCNIAIVFNGLARVMSPQQSPVAVRAGQVFVSVSSEGRTFSDTFDFKLVLQNEHETIQQSAGMRDDYRVCVEGYRSDAATLRKKLAVAPLGSPLHDDLSDRHRRVTQYLEAHQRRLESMSRKEANEQIPLEEIKRGVNGHTDPKMWL
ncbi:MAG: hypothetical protein V1899_00595 [Planctomycetota bacterium]